MLTGSNAHLLSQELASALTGRHIAIKLLPFSYKEFLGKDNKDSSESFLTYMTNGGYPDVVTGVAKPQTYLGVNSGVNPTVFSLQKSSDNSPMI